MCSSEQALLFGRAKREHESGARLLFTIYPKWRACSQATTGKDIYVKNISFICESQLLIASVILKKILVNTVSNYLNYTLLRSFLAAVS